MSVPRRDLDLHSDKDYTSYTLPFRAEGGTMRSLSSAVWIALSVLSLSRRTTAVDTKPVVPAHIRGLDPTRQC